MDTTRRSALLVAASLPTLALATAETKPVAAPVQLPDRTSFEASGLTYLDSGSQHPMSKGAKASVGQYLNKRTLSPNAQSYELPDQAVRQKFAKLVNADVDEIAFAQSTTAAEQMVLRGLGLPDGKSHVVVDGLHFFGSLPMYGELERQGNKVSWVRPRAGRIDLDDLRKAITPGTKLVSISLVSTVNGFQHDLKAVCDIAHERGALVYADIIHAAGCVPVDLHASGVDFAACATYKWLMGDHGLGFAYVRRDLQATLRRTEMGYYGLSKLDTHLYPFDTPGQTAVDYDYEKTASGLFSIGTHAHAVIAQLDHSLDYLAAVGVKNIQAHAQSLTDMLKAELPRLGYELMTPEGTTTPLVTCVFENAYTRLRPRLTAAGVRITTSRHRFRMTPSVFNDTKDIERFLSVLGRATQI